MTSMKDEQALREKLAAIEHQRWADWQRYCHEVIRSNKHDLETTLGWWDRQIALPYSALTDKEKASDMEQVDRYWLLVKEFAAEAYRQGQIDELNNLFGVGTDSNFQQIIDRLAVLQPKADKDSV